MGKFAQDSDGNIYTSDDGQNWKPAPMAQDADGGKFYNDGSAWQPVGGAAAGGNARPAAAAQRSSPSQPAAAPPSVDNADVAQGSPMSDFYFGQRPPPMVMPGTPVATSLYNTARQAPYDIEEAVRSSLGMMKHGARTALPRAFGGGGDPTGLVGIAGGGSQLAGAPFAPVTNPIFQGAVDPYVSMPLEKETGMPHELTDAIIGAAPLLGVKGGRAAGARPMEGEVLPADRPSVNEPPPTPDIEGEVAPTPEPAKALPAPKEPEVYDLPAEAIDRSLKPMRDVLGLSKDEKPAAPTGDLKNFNGSVADFNQAIDDFAATKPDRSAVEALHNELARRPSRGVAVSKMLQNIKSWYAGRANVRMGSQAAAQTFQGTPPPSDGGDPTQFNSGIDPKSLRAVIDPTGMDADSRQAESMIRDEIGMANRDTAITADLLEEHQRRVNMMTPVEKYDLFRYIQNRSNGFPINDPTLQGLADTMRDAFKERETKLRNLPSTAQMGFYEDYLPQLVKDPKAFAGGGLGVKQGSGAFTKERFYETIDDLIAAGHELKTDNPIELTMDYVTNADRYIALNAVRDTAEAAGDIAYITDRRRVPDGWDKLQGRLGVKHTPGGQVQGYAPEGFARVFNNFVSRGATGDWKNIYDMAARTSNAIQALEFAASQYHAFTVAMKAPVVEIGRAFQAVRRGAPMTAAKALAEAPMASITTALKGRKVQQIYLRRPGVNASAVDREVVNILTRANHRFKGLDPSKEYEYSAMRDYWRSWKRGALKTELLNDWANAKTDPLLGPPKMIMRHVGRIIQTIAKPVFEHYIPQLKNGAAFGAMKQWLELHPGANAADKLKAARAIVDQVDNMMGEMVHDNIFWQRAQKQVAQLAMTSFSWTFGNARWVAGAAADAPKAFMPRGDLSLRTATLLAYPIVLGTLSAMLQYLMTGKPPDDVTDLIAPKTGGKVQSGRAMVDERLMIPGSHKDWLGWYFHPGQEFKNKLSRGLHIGADLATGTDYRDDPLSAAKPYSPQWFMDYFKYAAQEMLPIAAQQTGQGKQGSHISGMARFIGFKEAPMYLQNPKGWEAWQASQASKATKTKIRHDKESERRYKGPVE